MCSCLNIELETFYIWTVSQVFLNKQFFLISVKLQKNEFEVA